MSGNPTQSETLLWSYDGINPYFNVLPVSEIHQSCHASFPTRLEALDDLIGALESQREVLSMEIASHKRDRRKLRRAAQ